MLAVSLAAHAAALAFVKMPETREPLTGVNIRVVVEPEHRAGTPRREHKEPILKPAATKPVREIPEFKEDTKHSAKNNTEQRLNGKPDFTEKNRKEAPRGLGDDSAGKRGEPEAPVAPAAESASPEGGGDNGAAAGPGMVTSNTGTLGGTVSVPGGVPGGTGKAGGKGKNPGTGKKGSNKKGSGGKRGNGTATPGGNGDESGTKPASTEHKTEPAPPEPPPFDWGSYAGCVIGGIQARKGYPPAARQQGITGSVSVVFTVSSGGGISGASVSKSSGSGVLDGAALGAVRSAPNCGPNPTGKTMSVTLTYKLN